MYKHFLKPILFRFNPETAHNMLFSLLKFLRHVPLASQIIRAVYKNDSPALEREVFGLNFPNPVGLAGGLDKNGEFYNDMANFGFGFVEIGSLTPLPQDGNQKPRCWRIPGDKAIINRFGINNKGVRNAVEHLKSERPEIIVAANISKNTSSINEEAARDYETSFALLYDFVDMFVVNVSCPNVVGLTSLQDISFLSEIVDRLLDLRMYYDIYKPVLLKLSPDLSHQHLDEIIDYSLRSGIDGIVAGNTTRSREGITSISPEKIEEIGNGGMSGAPVHKKNLNLVKYVHEKSGGRLPIIGVGGIMSPEDAKEMLDAGASLVEIYTGFIYEGPGLVKQIIKHLETDLKNKTE
ncbi:MAG: quinone-dependent dihydroorotate dehydrogenase [Bacteroidales bacterium]|mgnify:CR=1 FL=1|nr:quinone-dependent dihydroorotate dehydrogenase [Bacteroidales bacterium]MBQ6689834.1 quinone-dependent dihydroorotate dehydrogenase [Bacteroidales bacterium]